MPQLLFDPAIIVVLLLGISWFRTPTRARAGNLVAALALVGAVALTFARHDLKSVPVIVAAAAVGAAVGWGIAVRASMIHVPVMVAVQNGMGGLAASIVSLLELTANDGGPAAPTAGLSAGLGLSVGIATFSGSMVAAGKLANRLRQTPTCLPFHNTVLAGLGLALCLTVITAAITDQALLLHASAWVLVITAGLAGVVFSVRVGGADMPVLISFLNTTSAVAAALCGIVIHNRLLIACGATVAASGLILTYAMCRAMNRGLANVLTGIQSSGPATEPGAIPPNPHPLAETNLRSDEGEMIRSDPAGSDPFIRAIEAVRSAQSVIIVPGYGMALADAQEEAVHIAERLTSMGKEVLFAIHPVAGRMPGHMHVLLAEAEVDYGMIRELKDVNPQFANTDLALIVGACDVVNPAAIGTTGTPISGMPILLAHEARNVVVCNLDERPGYSDVDNPLYRDPRTILLLGDAKETLARLLQDLT